MVNRALSSNVLLVSVLGLIANASTARGAEPEPQSPPQNAPQSTPTPGTGGQDKVAAAPEAPRVPLVFHAPTSSQGAARGLSLDARVRNADLLAELWVELRPAASALDHPTFERFGSTCVESKGSFEPATSTCRLVLLRRATPEVYGVDVTGELIQPPGFTYALFARDTAEHTAAVFASREHPFAVLVDGESEASRRADRLERHRGHTSQVALRSELSFFGPSRVETFEGGRRTDPYSDVFGSVELEYTSRPLRGIYAFRMGLGVMRGQRATFEGADGQTTSLEDGPEPGLNYGFGELVFEADRIFYLTPRLTLGASEAGFSAGVGIEATLGRPTSTRLELGVDWVSGLGARGWLTFAWTTVPHFPMGLTVELTGYPDDAVNPTGSRLIYDLGIELSDAFTLGLRFGYAQRSTAFDGSLVSGLGATFDF